MLIKIIINTETLEYTIDDPSVVINDVKQTGNQLLIEISKPDDEKLQMMAGSGTTWQQ
jgi:hypothetical protein